MAHCRIPPRACTWQSDVEVFHKLIEEELYELEDYGGKQEFLGKSYAYALYFNFKRQNRYRGRKTPSQKRRAAQYLTRSSTSALPCSKSTSLARSSLDTMYGHRST